MIIHSGLTVVTFLYRSFLLYIFVLVWLELKGNVKSNASLVLLLK